MFVQVGLLHQCLQWPALCNGSLFADISTLVLLSPGPHNCVHAKIPDLQQCFLGISAPWLLSSLCLMEVSDRYPELFVSTLNGIFFKWFVTWQFHIIYPLHFPSTISVATASPRSAVSASLSCYLLLLSVCVTSLCLLQLASVAAGGRGVKGALRRRPILDPCMVIPHCFTFWCTSRALRPHGSSRWFSNHAQSVGNFHR